MGIEDIDTVFVNLLRQIPLYFFHNLPLYQNESSAEISEMKNIYHLIIIVTEI